MVSLEEEKTLNEALRKSTNYNLHDTNQKSNQRGYKGSIEEDTEKANLINQQIVLKAPIPREEFSKTREETRHQEIATQVPVEGDKNKTEHIKTGERFDKKETLQIVKTASEIFYYDISWLGIHVGKAVLEAIDNNGVIRITSQINSAPFLSAFYRVEDFAESVIIDGMPVNFRIKQLEGKYRSQKETIFDVNHKIITFFNYLKDTRDEHAIKSENIWDVISGFYYLRTLPLEVGKAVYIDIFDSNKFYKAQIDVLKKEKIKVAHGDEIDTILVKPTLQSEGLFQRKGDILIWISDDEKRIPVRVATSVSVGNVVAELQNSEAVKSDQ
jgi:hypothetical protein